MSARVYSTCDEDETIALGRRLAAELKPPVTVLLTGNLGAGKTTLAKGIVEGLGVAIADEVSSPTFTLIHEYGGGVFHIDLYRLETEREVASLGLDDIFDRPDAFVLIEWGERFLSAMPAKRMEIRITAEGGQRTITVTSAGGAAGS